MDYKNSNFFSSLDQEDRISHYKKDKFNEFFLESLNFGLSELNIDYNVKDMVKNRKSFPSIIVTGSPRSGTTLITQLLSSCYSLGYASNLMARFYQSPLTGAWLQNQLIPDDIQSLRTYNSRHGVTKSIYEPHEFGYFWSRYLNTSSSCHDPLSSNSFNVSNIELLHTDLMWLTKVFGKPAVYKCSIAPFFMDFFMKYTNAYFIHIVRDKNQVVDSILNTRQERLGSVDKWWSIKPYGWEEAVKLKPVDQVEWQYDKVVNKINSIGLEYKNRVYKVELENLVNNTQESLHGIMENFMEYCDISVERVGPPIPTLRHQT